MLEGDGLYIGVRKLEWNSGAKGIFDAFVGEPEEKTEKYHKYMHGSIPVYIYLFDDSDCVRSTDQVLYENEYFKLPNTYQDFINLHPWTS